jgi:imidazole glycerol-phosphate synthase subunit HisF
MLKSRIVGVVVVRDGWVVQSIGFQRFLPVGRPSIAVEYLNRWGIDEIVLLDITASRQGRSPNFTTVSEVSKLCHVPLSVGGGIRHLQDVKQLLASGADKVIVNRAALEDPTLLRRAASVFGNQCIVTSIDVRREANGCFRVMRDGGTHETEWELKDWAAKVEQNDAGEILLTSIDQDGAQTGYDVECIRAVANAVRIPVIACGGVGHPRHFVEAFAVGASAAAAGNFFHFAEHSPQLAKEHLSRVGVDVRQEVTTSYARSHFASDGRVEKIDDAVLEALRFEVMQEEVI